MTDVTIGKKTLISIFLLISVSLFVSGLAVATVQGAYNQDFPKHTHLGLSESQHTTLDKDIGDAAVTMKKYIDKQISGVQKNVTSLQNYDEVITLQIGNINDKLRNLLPGTTGLPDEGQTTQSTPAFLTLKMDKIDYVLGNTITFYGMAKPNLPVILTLKLPDRTLDSIAASKTAIIDGQWSVNFTLRLDDPLGTWQVYARQGQQDQTKTLTFKVE